ncbi:MAG: S8 family serine peptidase [candidate division Zixibacteria bacterium]|nr:S8 family serine peptidase [candidate division Zixibacteria bacterium]MBU1470132.1 S8 family serine peptidase [candidate division Zixibacteria bacterium]
MRQFIITSILVISVSVLALADDYIRIDSDSVGAGTTANLDFYITRQCVVEGYPDLPGASNGFSLTATGGATFTYDSLIKHHDTDWFTMTGLLFNHTFTGGEDTYATFLAGGLAVFTGGIPIVTEEPYFTVRLDIGTDPGAIYIDSAFFPPAGPWKWSELTCGGGSTGNRPGFLDKNFNPGSPFMITVYQTTCQPPVITNKPPNDTLVADNCNALTYQFQADPGGVGGNGSIYWELLGGGGFADIDSLTGLFTFQSDQAFDYGMQVQVVNDCSPPQADTYFFTVRAETAKEVVKKERDGLPTLPWVRSNYVFGPAEAESVGVWIETNGSTAELEAMGIRLGNPRRTNLYTATLSVEELIEVKKLKSVIKISLMRRGGDVEWALDIQSSPQSPDLDTSTAYFFADSARALYGVDGTGVLIGVIDRECDPLNEDFFFGSNDSKVLYFWDQDGSGGDASSVPYGCEWTKSDFDIGNYSQVDTTLGSTQAWGHGTLVAGIAAGSGRSSAPPPHFVGVAPGANLILVSLPSSSQTADTNYLNALEYIVSKAADESMPCIVNMSVGRNLDGPRDGSSYLELEISDILWDAPYLTDHAFLCAASAGNKGWDGLNPEVRHNYDGWADHRSHAHGIGAGSFKLDVPTSNTNPITSDSIEYFNVAIWYDGLFCSIRVCSPTDTTDWVPKGGSQSSVCGDDYQRDYFRDGLGHFTLENEIWNHAGVYDPYPGRASHFCRLSFGDGISAFTGTPYHIPAGKWTVELSGYPGEWDAYIYDSRTTVAPLCVQVDSSDYDVTRTITEPACVPEVITVASVNTKCAWTSCYTGREPASSSMFDSSGYDLGDISFFSSRGPSRLNGGSPAKPEAFAPGAWIASTEHNNVFYPGWQYADDYAHVHAQGTSVSSPHVAGAIALALEADSTLTSDSVRTILARLPTVDGSCFNVVDFMQQVASPECIPGDANASDAVDIDDIIYLIAYIFTGGPAPVPLVCCADSDGSCSVDLDDVVYTIAYVFTGGPQPVPSCYTCP